MKRIIVCCDGTWNKPDQVDRGKHAPTNPAKMAEAVAPRDQHGAVQQVFYETGVGTRPGERIRGGAFGAGLSRNILDAYRYLVREYEEGDELFLFGFSRGAYTARSLAGLIRNCGVLRPEYGDGVEGAYQLYRRRDNASHPTEHEATLFRKTYAYGADPPFITCLGVWDTVGALGIPIGRLGGVSRQALGLQFHDVELSRFVRNAFHAVAIDERRGAFAPSLWEQPIGKDKGGQRVEQVWFAGVHANIGGGYADAGLSDVAFRWIVERAAACGLAFDPPYIAEELRPNPLGELRDSRTGFYRFLPRHVREVCAPPEGMLTCESVHPSVIERLTSGLAYHPENLPAGLLRASPEHAVAKP